MNKYTTIYENYSDSQLTDLFSSESWKSLSFSQRLDACQEVENRYAAENNVQPCMVTHELMNGADYGWQNGNIICLNTYLLQDCQFCTNFTDADGKEQSVRTDIPAPGWNTLETVYHEGTHGVQEHTGNMPSVYISPEMDYDLYRIQGVEKEAYAVGQTKALESLSEYETKTNQMDSERNEYIASVKADSFQAALLDASHNYNDTHIEQTLQMVINDREEGIQRTEVSDSYRAINDLCDSYGVYSAAAISSGLSDSSEIGSAGLQSVTEHPAAVSQTDELDDGMASPLDLENSIILMDAAYEDGSEQPDFSNSSDPFTMDDGMIDSMPGTAFAVNDAVSFGTGSESDYGSITQSHDNDGSESYLEAGSDIGNISDTAMGNEADLFE